MGQGLGFSFWKGERMTSLFTRKFLDWCWEQDHIDNYCMEAEFIWFQDNGEWFPLDVFLENQKGKDCLITYLGETK